MAKRKKKLQLKSPVMEETIPHQINSPTYQDADPKLREPFVNEHGVVIGDSFYDSPNSPLNHWSKDTDPEIMAGDQWVHPTNDIGWNSTENAEMANNGINPKGVPFTHPTRDVSYLKD